MSVIGNAILLSGGGGGGLSVNKPLIHVTATKGATVNFSTGGVLVKSIGPNDAFNNNKGGVAEYYYPASTGTWTVAATNGTASTSTTLTVTENKEYDLELIYGYWLHRAGVGLLNSASASWSSGSSGNVADADEISTTQTGAFVCLCLSPSVSLAGYSACYFEYVKELEGNMASSYSEAKTGRFGFGTNTTTGSYNSDQKLITTIRPNPTSTWTATSISLDGVSSTAYFKFCNWNNGKMGVRNLYFL